MRQVFKVMMAAVLVALLSWGSVARVFAQEATGRPFITKWRGIAGTYLSIPILGTEYKIVIKNEKGEVVETKEKVTRREQGYPYHAPFVFTPKADGVYTVEAGPEGVKCMLMGVVWYNGSWFHLTSNDRLLEVVQFGTVAWESMYRMFARCENMTFAANIDTPDLTKVTNMEDMFWGCSAFNQPLGAWKLPTPIDLSQTAMSAVNYSLSLIGWAKQTDGASNIRFRSRVNGLVYNDAGKEAREKLIARGWTFKGDVYRPSEKVAITLDAGSEGRLAIEGYDDEALQAVAVCTELTVRATPKEGYTLTSLMAGTQDILATKKFTVTEAVTVKAVFKTIEEAPKGAITLAEEGEGTIEIEGYDKEALQAVAVGTELKVSATPKEGYTLTSLMAGSLDIFATKKFTVTGAMTVKAVFKKKGAITLVKEGEGTLAIEGYNDKTLQAVAEGTELTVTATPKEGYTLTSLMAGSLDIFATKKFTVTGAMTVKAVFKKKGAITLVKEGEGTLAIEGYNDAALQTVAAGTELTVVATPKEGYTLTSLTVGSQDILATKKFTVTEAVTVKAVFTKNGGSNPGGGSTTFAVTLAKEGEGTLAIEGYNDETLQAVAEGTELTVIATPKEGYTLTSLTVGSQDILATKKFTVTEAVTVKAVFTKNGGSNPGGGSTTFAVTLAKEGEGTLAIEGYNDETLQAVAEGTELTVIATPKEGYTLTSLSAGTQDILATKKFTVTGAVTVKAVFTKNGGSNPGGGSTTFAVTLAKEGEGTLAIEGYNDETLQAVAEGTELTVIATPKEGYTLTSLTVGSQDIFATKKFTVTGAVTVKAVFKKKGNNGGGNNGGGNGGGSWQPQTPQAVEDAVLASVVVAPNPFTAQLRIVTPEGIAVRYELVTLTGNVVRAGVLEGTETIVDTEALPAGLYFVRFRTSDSLKRSVKAIKY